MKPILSYQNDPAFKRRFVRQIDRAFGGSVTPGRTHHVIFVLIAWPALLVLVVALVMAARKVWP